MPTIVSAVLVLALAGAARAAPPLTIVALGDSTTEGTPYYHSPVELPPDGAGDASASWPRVLETLRPGWRVLNAGIAGQRADEIRARFESNVLPAQPRFVIVLAGVNDVYQGRPLGAVEADLAWMYARARRAGIEPVAASVLPFTRATPEQNARLRELNAWIAKNAPAQGASLCDTHAAAASKENADALAGSPDGLHPDRETYRLVAKALAACVDARLKAARRPKPAR